MSITPDTMVLDILDQHPNTVEVFRKYGMGQIEDPNIRAMAAGATLQTAFSFLGMSADQQEAMLQELNQIAGN